MFGKLSIQSVLSRSTLGNARFLTGGLTGALAMLAIIAGLGISDLPAQTGAPPSGETVNRTLKGDRLSEAPVFHPNAVHQAPRSNAHRVLIHDLILPDGCESLVSPLANFQLAQIAGRCVS